MGRHTGQAKQSRARFFFTYPGAAVRENLLLRRLSELAGHTPISWEAQKGAKCLLANIPGILSDYVMTPRPQYRAQKAHTHLISGTCCSGSNSASSGLLSADSRIACRPLGPELKRIEEGNGASLVTERHQPGPSARATIPASQPLDLPFF